MKQYVMTIDLKNDAALIEKYKAHHQAVWPQVLESLKAVGILEMKIYLLGQRLFMVIDTVDDFDVTVDLARYLTLDPRCQEWENLMDSFQQKVAEAQPDEKWARMERVFDLNS